MKNLLIQNPFDDQVLFEKFCNHLSAHITSFGFHTTLWKWKSDSFNHLDNDPILLLVNDTKILNKFRKIAYEQVLEEICQNLSILENCYDVYRSEIADEEFFILVSALKKLKPTIVIKQHSNGYIVNVPTMISDLIMPAISVFHSYASISLGQFLQALDAFGGDPSRIFLNAKGPTFTFQFVETWVAHILKVPKKPHDGLTLVI